MSKGEHILHHVPDDVTAKLLSYLGGELSATDTQAFETRLLEDEFFSRQIEEAGFLLAEACADGSLSGKARDHVATWIASSPHSQRHVRITQSLHRLSAPQQSRNLPARWLWATAAAACIALFALLPLLHRHHANPPANLTADSTPNAIPAAVRPSAPPDTILLVAEQLRGAAHSRPAMETYSVHAAAPVRIQIVIPSAHPGSVYSASVHQAGVTKPAARADNIHVQTTSGSAVAEMMLPPQSLKPGEYSLDLTAPGERFEMFFRVVSAK